MLLRSSADFFQNKWFKKRYLIVCQTVVFGWSFIYFEGSQTEISNLYCISVAEE